MQQDDSVSAPAPSLFEQTVALSTLYRAWDRVEENNGCAGVDGVTVEKFSKKLGENLSALNKALLKGSYSPLPLLRFFLEKPDGGKRPISVPVVKDRVAQTAATIVLSPLFETKFEQCSFAYRRNRSYQQAIAEVKRHYDEGFRWVIDADIDQYFDEIDHKLLLDRVQEWVPDSKLFELIQKWVRGRIYQGGRIEAIEKGIPQGSPISPLLANMFLDKFDETIEKAGHRLVRFADDFIVLCRDKGEAYQALELTEKVLSGLHLKLDEADLTHFDHGFQFLGSLFLRSLIVQREKKKPAALTKPVRPPRLRSLAEVTARFGAPKTVLSRALANAVEEMGREESGNFLLAGQVGRAVPVVAQVGRENSVSGHEPHARTLFLQEQGAILRKEDEHFLVTKHSKTLKKVPAIHVDQIIAFGNCGFTTPAMQFCLKRRIPITLLSSRGEFYGVVDSFSPEAIELQRKQFTSTTDPAFSAEAARVLVKGKLRSQQALLKRQHSLTPQAEKAVDAITALLKALERAETVDQLRGYEGAGAAAYYPAYASLLKDAMGFSVRQKQPPRDPINSLLSLGYTLAFYNLYSVVRAVGLNPHVGCLHDIRQGHPALTSDLLEEFRAPIVDSLVLEAVNRGVFKAADFETPPDQKLACFLTPLARIRFIQQFESKMNSPVVHPHTSLNVDWRRCLHLQAMEWARFVRGKIPEYRPMEVP